MWRRKRITNTRKQNVNLHNHWFWGNYHNNWSYIDLMGNVLITADFNLVEVFKWWTFGNVFLQNGCVMLWTIIVRSFFLDIQLAHFYLVMLTNEAEPLNHRTLTLPRLSHGKPSISSQEWTAFVTAAFGLPPLPWSCPSDWTSFI